MLRAALLAAVLILPALALAQAPSTADAAQAVGGSAGRDPGPYADSRDREAWLYDQIVRAQAAGALDRKQTKFALRDLDRIQKFDGIYRGTEGRMSAEQTRDIEMRLDMLIGELAPALERARAARR